LYNSKVELYYCKKKSPKLYFYDVGLASWLIGITEESHLQAHPLRGSLFKNLEVLEMLKARSNAEVASYLYAGEAAINEGR